MKIRTLDELEEGIDRETGWRKQELAFFMGQATLKKKSTDLYPALRSAVCMTYAHWEGWVRGVCRLYLSYLNGKKLPSRELSSALLGTVVRSRVEQIKDSQSPDLHIDLANWILETFPNERAKFREDLINTQSNLNAERFTDIVKTAGLNENQFAIYDQVVERLLIWRNSIAHGEHHTNSDATRLNFETFDEVYQRINEALDLLTSEVRAAAYKLDAEAYSR